MWSTQTPPGELRRVGTLDPKGDKRARAISFAMRFFAVLVFVPLFAGVAMMIHPTVRDDPATLWTINGGSSSPLLAYAVLVVEMVALLLLHEAIHLLVYRIGGVDSARLRIDGLTPTVGAEGWYTRRVAMIFNAAAPFFDISVVGVLLFLIVSPPRIAWVYIPVVVNAAVSVGDYITIAWLLLLPRGSWISGDGSALIAWAPSAVDGE